MNSNDPNDKEFVQSDFDPLYKDGDTDLLNSQHDVSIEGKQAAEQGNFLPDQKTADPIRFAGFWMRFWAYLFDLVVVGSIDRILISPIFRAMDIPLNENSLFAPITIATAITFYAYFVLMTKFFGQTLGKMVFGLKVVDLEGKKLTWGTIIFREWIGRFISVTIFIGYVIVAFLPKKQGLHDLFADTSVVHERQI
ncbi:putative RDD family membrane protein YckC [Cytobacillus oceanisediminis]|uniref:Putative RDD family membrane protein YckC n=1 Tax=Cytobacillus oceanisediminis TaxID=665099 RepID=A0A2V2ZR52_9BACI|nr:RDD family protein [Cytobacillus oceanisediminis]PWW26129.1 putative RDD family membrane protein YckC [Cytobacillus oceanisediminis]